MLTSGRHMYYSRYTSQNMKKVYAFLFTLCLLFMHQSLLAVTHIITQTGTSFNPNTLEVEVGDVVKWVWTAGSHTTTSTSVPAGATPWNSLLTSDETEFQYTVLVEGTYEYVCTPHAAMGMTGSFVAVASSVNCSVQPSLTQMENTVTVSINGTGATNPLYSIDWGDGSDASNMPVVSHTYTEPGTYEICVTYIDQGNPMGCFVHNCDLSVVIDGGGTPECSVELSTVISGNIVSVVAEGTGLTDGQYIIDWGDGSSTESSTGVHQYEETGDYTICVGYGNMLPGGCYAETCEEVTIEESIECSVELTITANGNTYSATAVGTGATIPQYVIDWGDDSDPIQSDSGTHTYTEEGEYEICVIYVDTTNPTGCVATECETIEVVITSVKEPSAWITGFSLFPNPAKEAAVLEFGLQAASVVNIEMLDILGKTVQQVYSGNLVQGIHRITFDTQSVSEGVYLVQLKIGAEQHHIRMVKE